MTAAILRLVTFRASVEASNLALATHRVYAGPGLCDVILGSRPVDEGLEVILASTWESLDHMQEAVHEAVGVAVGWPQTTRIVETFDLKLLRTFCRLQPARLVRVYRGVLDEDVGDRIGEYAERDLFLVAGNPSCSLFAVGLRESGQAVAVSLWSERAGIETLERMKVDQLWRWSWQGAPTDALHYEVLTARLEPE